MLTRRRPQRLRSVSVRNCGDPIAADPPGGWGGWGLGKPDRTVWPTARLSVAGTPVPTYYDGFPKAPPTPPALSAVLKVGSRTRVARLSCAARAPRGGRERRVGLRKPVVVRRDRRTAYRHSGARLDGPLGFPKAHPSLPPGERAVRVRTETLPPAVSPRWP